MHISYWLIPLLVSGCSIGNGRICGPLTSPANCDKVTYENLMRPYGARWVKSGMTRESRLADWVACGGGSNLGNGFRKWIQPEPWDKFWPAHQKHDADLRSCMLSKGYAYKSPSQPNKPDECTPEICMYP